MIIYPNDYISSSSVSEPVKIEKSNFVLLLNSSVNNVSVVSGQKNL